MTQLSLPSKGTLDLTDPSTFQAKFWGFGSDGTVGANKSAIKIIGDHTENMYKAISIMIRKIWWSNGFSSAIWGYPIRSTYLIEHADFVACHTPAYLHTYDLLKGLKKAEPFY